MSFELASVSICTWHVSTLGVSGRIQGLNETSVAFCLNFGKIKQNIKYYAFKKHSAARYNALTFRKAFLFSWQPEVRDKGSFVNPAKEKEKQTSPHMCLASSVLRRRVF